jgi:hypothetical protein
VTEVARSAVSKRILELSIVFVGLLGCAAFATWPFVADIATKAAFDPGDPLLSAWLFGWGAHAAVDAPLRLFDANMFFPQGLTLAFTENMLGLSLPFAPLFWVTGNALLIENVALIAYVAVAGLGAYLLVREIGASPLLAFVCAAAYAVTPYRLTQFGHPHVVGTHWLPFIVLMLLRLSQRDLAAAVARRRTIGLALFFTLQVWSSLTGAAMAGIIVGAWLIWLAARERRHMARPVVRVAAGLAAALVLSVPIIAPYVVVRDRHPGYRHSDEETRFFSAKPASYLSPRGGGALSADLYGELAERFTTPAENWEKRVFPGAWLLVASIAGLVILATHRFRQASVAGFGLVLTAVFFVFSLGPRVGGRADGVPLPFWVLQEVFGGLTRVPSRFGIVVPLGLALVAGAGLSRLPRRAGHVVGAISIVLVGAEMAPITMSVVPVPRITSAHRAVADREGTVLALPTTELLPSGAPDYSTLPVDAQHLFLSTAHFRPLVNGYGAYHPPSYWEVVGAVQDFPSANAFRVLKSRDVQTVVVQTELLARAKRWNDVVARLQGWPGVTEIASAQGVHVYDITGATTAVSAAPG